MADRRGRTLGDRGNEQIDRSGAPSLLLERYAGRLEYHTPWSIGRDVSHLFRGLVDLDEACALLASEGLGWLRLVDNGIIHEHEPGVPELALVHAYHLVPSAASKARSVARHMQIRGYSAQECIAVGDSREDLGCASVVGTFWLVANALDADPSLREDVGSGGNVRIATAGYGSGVYEAVVTTLAEGQ
jgi:phosphoglycolate phosphatase